MPSSHSPEKDFGLETPFAAIESGFRSLPRETLPTVLKILEAFLHLSPGRQEYLQQDQRNMIEHLRKILLELMATKSDVGSDSAVPAIGADPPVTAPEGSTEYKKPGITFDIKVLGDTGEPDTEALATIPPEARESIKTMLASTTPASPDTGEVGAK